MINNKGFVSTIILISILGVLAIGGGTYLGVKKIVKLSENKQVEKKPSSALVSNDDENKSLEIEKLKLENNIIKQEQDVLKNKLTQSNTNKNSSVLSTDSSYSKIPINSIVQLGCLEDALHDLGNPTKDIFGSGVFIDSKHGWILTNKHVVNGNENTTCTAMVKDAKDPKKLTAFHAKVQAVMVDMDAVILEIDYLMHDSNNPTEGLVEIPKNYTFPETTASCSDNNIQLGSKLAVVGYPGVGGQTITITEGIVSGFEGDYIKTSAKIEHGNSGGGAFLLSNGCMIGIPTASVVGEVESLGRILRWK